MKIKINVLYDHISLDFLRIHLILKHQIIQAFTLLLITHQALEISGIRAILWKRECH